MTKRQIAERQAHIRAEHHKACKICAVTLAVLGLLAITSGYENSGLVVHIFGLYMAELI